MPIQLGANFGLSCDNACQPIYNDIGIIKNPCEYSFLLQTAGKLNKELLDISVMAIIESDKHIQKNKVDT